MNKCSSCGEDVLVGYTEFKCPQCGEEKIVRCTKCRSLGVSYTCKCCSFKGP